MRFSNSLLRRWRSLREKEANNLALREELQFHLDRQTDENIANGMSFDAGAKGSQGRFRKSRAGYRADLSTREGWRG